MATYCIFPIRGSDFDPLWEESDNQDVTRLRRASDESLPLFSAIREAGVVRERPLVVETLKAVADGRIDLDAIIGGEVTEPFDLTDCVETALIREVSLINSRSPVLRAIPWQRHPVR